MDINEFKRYVTEVEWPVVERDVAEYWVRAYSGRPAQLERMRDRLRKEREAELAKRDAVIRAGEAFLDYPEEVRSLFLQTAGWMVENEREKVARAKELHEAFEKIYGECRHVEYRIRTDGAEWMTDTHKINLVNASSWEIAKGMTDEEKVELFDRAHELRTAEKVAANALDAQGALALWARKMGAIDEMIRERMSGVPEGFEREVRWGVGGYYNGVLVRNGVRVSFKSFWAGGWNIQRAHIRVRLTELKARKGKEG